MAHMLPKVFPLFNKSGGEKTVFEYFKQNAPDNWHILHSFRLPEHLRVIFGESDFIVVAPRYGIFVLEIKSGGVGFDGTDWLFVNRNHTITRKQRGPFQQAREGMFEVEKIINRHASTPYRRENFLYGYGVIFTDECNFPLSAITEDEPWRLMQKTDGGDYCEFIRRLAANFKQELRDLGRRLPGEITDSDAEAIVSALRPEVECVPPMKSFVDNTERDIITLTNEQYSCLDDIELNDRNVIFGGAGTGKTLLALEDARRTYSAGKKVAVFCYNKPLYKSISKSLPPEIDVFYLHGFLATVVNQTVTNKDENDNNFFENVLPQTALAVLNHTTVKYDKIIVDEFQDICIPNYLDVIDAILDGGLKNGLFSFYGDFAGQAIFNPRARIENLSRYTFFSRKHLTINCRNTTNIGNEIVNVTGFNDTRYMFPIVGEPVDYKIWSNVDEEINGLKETLNSLQEKGFRSEDIFIISPKKRINSVIGEFDPEKLLIGDIDDNPAAYRARFATIQSFKGLESKIVIITDIDNYNDTQLAYVALSRARSKLYILETLSAHNQRTTNMTRRP